jgi:hypothetical protein
MAAKYTSSQNYLETCEAFHDYLLFLEMEVHIYWIRVRYDQYFNFGSIAQQIRRFYAYNYAQKIIHFNAGKKRLACLAVNI